MATPDPASLPQRTPDPKLALQPHDQLVLRGPRMDFVLRPAHTAGGKIRVREVVVHPGAVIILPVLDDGRIVLIRNYRHTVLEELWELPAGTLELGEEPVACAARELTEETGYTAAQLVPLGWFYTSPGILTEKMYAFLATALTVGQQQLEAHELIRVQPLSVPEIRRLIRENLIVDAKTIATLLKYLLD